METNKLNEKTNITQSQAMNRRKDANFTPEEDYLQPTEVPSPGHPQLKGPMIIYLA